MSIKIGCSGFQEARTKYYNEFPLVEVQQTFFQPPPIGTALKWRAQAPGHFEFSIKAWQLITHEPINNAYRNLREKLTARSLTRCGHFQASRMVFDAWQRTEAVAQALGAKVIVFQTAKTFLPTPENIKNFRNFFKRIKRKNYHLVWEPTRKWHLSTILPLCDELNLIYTSTPFSDESTHKGPIRYYRLKGKNGYRSRYDDQDFKKLIQLDTNGTPCYYVFNNASMLFDARNCMNALKQEEMNQISTNPVDGVSPEEEKSTGKQPVTTVPAVNASPVIDSALKPETTIDEKSSVESNA